MRVTVRDHGIGIPDADRPRIFTKFFRGSKGLGGIGGMGLGLAVSRDIVEAHGGRMGFESKVDRGRSSGSSLVLTLSEIPPRGASGGYGSAIATA